MSLFFDTPLWAAAHLPHKGGDHIDINVFTQHARFQISRERQCRLISPLVGEMSGRTEGGEYSSPRMR
jgi:hypothetical protein